MVKEKSPATGREVRLGGGFDKTPYPVLNKLADKGLVRKEEQSPGPYLWSPTAPEVHR